MEKKSPQLRAEQSRQQFIDYVVAGFEPHDQEEIQSALLFAEDMHSGDRYAGGPYTFHLTEVANRALRGGFVGEDNVGLIIAILLHDVVEDQPAAVMEEAFDNNHNVRTAVGAISVLFHVDIAEAVASVSNSPLSPSLKASMTEEQRIDHYVSGVKKRLTTSTMPETAIMKTYDIATNIENLLGVQDIDKQWYLTRKYQQLPEILRPCIERLWMEGVLDQEQYYDLMTTLDRAEYVITQTMIVYTEYFSEKELR